MTFTDFIPLWAILALARVLTTTSISLFQERVKADAYSVAFWTKVFVATVSAPFAFYFGFPTSPAFYTVVFLTAVIWCIGDVVFFKAVSTVGAAVVARLSPISIIVTFFLWFFFDRALLAEYLANPAKSLAILTIIVAAASFAFRLRKCEISARAIRMTWFLILASCMDAVILKMLLGSEPAEQGVFGFIFCQAIMMIGLWSLFGLVKKPVSKGVFFGRNSLYAGSVVGVFSASGMCLRSFGLINVDNPAFFSVILLLDSVLIATFNRLRGRKDTSDMVSGFGIVFCAFMLIVVKAIP